MTKKLRVFGLMTTVILMAFLSMASQFAVPLAQSIPTATATVTGISKARATAMALEAQAGNSDGILFLGILIFLFIATPILLRNRHFHTPK